MEPSPCIICKFRKRSKHICMNIQTYCKKLLDHQSKITEIPSQSPDFSGEYSTPGRNQLKKGGSYDID